MTLQAQLSDTAARNAAYRRLALTVLGLDVATVTADLRGRLEVHPQTRITRHQDTFDIDAHSHSLLMDSM